jgi:endonuclease YncB( thermonuclease family)
LVDAGQVAYTTDGRSRCDCYGRTLAHLHANGRDVAAVLIAEGLVLPYAPGRGAKLARLRTWCGLAAELPD